MAGASKAPRHGPQCQPGYQLSPLARTRPAPVTSPCEPTTLREFDPESIMAAPGGSPFPLCGDLFKLKHKAPTFGSAWNKRYVTPYLDQRLAPPCTHYCRASPRFFVVETRQLRTGPQAFFSYYPDEKRSSNIKEAGDSPVLLQEVMHISLSETAKVEPLCSAGKHPHPPLRSVDKRPASYLPRPVL